MENKLKESILIEQAIVVGEGQKFPSALVIPEFNALKDWCNRNDIAYTTNEQMVCNEKVKQKFNEDVKALMQSIAQYEQVKKIHILPALFTIEGGELTPTLKLKRKVIHTKYSHLIEKLYE